MKIALLILFLVFLPFRSLFAQSGESSVPDTSSNAIIKQAEETDVAVPIPSEKALRFYRSGNYLYVFVLMLSFLLPLFILFTGFSAKIRNWSGHIAGQKWFIEVGIYFVIYSAILFIIYLPLSYYLGFVRLHDYGLSNQTFLKWFGDSIKGAGINMIGGFLLLWVPYLLLRKSPKRWWLYISMVSVPFIVIVILIKPVWIDPVFNEFGDMNNKELETKILALAERAGIEDSRVFEVNKSVDTNAMNAYVTGFAGTKRIVLWDTMINKLDEEELLVVMGHEIGHYALNHIHWGIALGSGGTFLMFFLIYKSASRIVGKFKEKLKFSSLGDVASYPLFILLINFYSLLGQPFANGFSRYIEHEADRFALEITQDNFAGANAFVKLQHHNLSNPRPGALYKFVRATHPPLGERIDFCNAYRPWKTGETLRYQHLFK